MLAYLVLDVPAVEKEDFQYKSKTVPVVLVLLQYDCTETRLHFVSQLQVSIIDLSFAQYIIVLYTAYATMKKSSGS